MLRNTTALALVGAFSLALPVVARAEPDDATDNHLHSSTRPAHYSFGFRVGGYGYRNTEDPDKGEWDDCRMNGLGVFGQRTLTRHLFAEAGVDLYSAADLDEQLAMGGEPMDRVSGLLSAAGGARVTLFGRLSPYVQLGVGAEITRARVGQLEDRGVYPMAFFGLGADLRVTRRLLVGANARTNVMKHYLHADADTGFASEYDAAAQGQFFVKLDM